MVLDLLDPKHILFKSRFYRKDCTKTASGLYIKDLTKFNFDQKSTIIIDNAIVSFAYQLDNGIPIIPYYDDPEDRILPKIKDYCISLKDLSDIRIINRKTFSLTELCRLKVNRFIKYYEENSENNTSLNNSTENENPNNSKGITLNFVEKRLGKIRISLDKYLENSKNSLN